MVREQEAMCNKHGVMNVDGTLYVLYERCRQHLCRIRQG